MNILLYLYIYLLYMHCCSRLFSTQKWINNLVHNAMQAINNYTQNVYAYWFIVKCVSFKGLLIMCNTN